MQPTDLQIEIETIKAQIGRQEKLLDIALKRDVEFIETKKLLHEIRLLRDRLGELLKQKQTATDI